MYPTPILHIEVEGVKHSLVQHLQASHDEFCQIVEEEIAAIDIAQLIRTQVRQAIPRMVQDIVEKSVTSIGSSVLFEARYSQAFGEIVRAAIDDAAQSVLNPQKEQ